MSSRSYVRVGSAAVLALALAVPAGGAIAQDGASITFLTPPWGVPPDADALAAFEGPIVEVHISNPNSREPWRHTSVIAPVATGSVMGFGKQGYDLAVRAVAAKIAA